MLHWLRIYSSVHLKQTRFRSSGMESINCSMLTLSFRSSKKQNNHLASGRTFAAIASKYSLSTSLQEWPITNTESMPFNELKNTEFCSIIVSEGLYRSAESTRFCIMLLFPLKSLLTKEPERGSTVVRCPTMIIESEYAFPWICRILSAGMEYRRSRVSV